MEANTTLKIVVDMSAQLTTWALAIGGGSVAAVVGTSYFRPQTKRGRLVYLLFLPGWWFLGSSVYEGDQLARRYIASQLVRADLLKTIAEHMNSDFAHQRQMLGISLAIFSAWLVAYLLWWVFGSWTVTEKGGKP